MTFPKLSDLIDDGYSLKPAMKWPRYDSNSELDRQKYMTASESGRCARQIKFRQESPALPFNRWGYAERGHVIEDWAANLIREALSNDLEIIYEVMFTGKEQVSFADGNQSGTPDGILIDVLDNKSMVFDIKSLDPRYNYANLPKEDHYSQVTQNADLINRSDFPYTVTHTAIIYIDASDLQKRKEIVQELDPHHAKQLRDKAKEIAQAKSPADLPAEGMFTDKGCDYCPFTGECGVMVTASSETKKHERAMKNVFR